MLFSSLTSPIKNFILELCIDFIFVSEEFRLQVCNQDFFIDLLFYHRGLSALVAFELKIGKFLPEHMGQLNFYLEALDRDVKKPHENPSIGILLCKDKELICLFNISLSSPFPIIIKFKLGNSISNRL